MEGEMDGWMEGKQIFINCGSKSKMEKITWKPNV
jgi:hypothetical protein